MSRKETGALMVIIQDLYPRYYANKTEDEIMRVISAWHSVLDDIDFEKAVDGLRYFVKESSYPPTVADIRANVEPEYKYLADIDLEEK